MPAITIPDLNQAKQNTDFIDRLATSSALTTSDRLGRERRTFEGIDAEADSRMAQIDAAASAQMAEQQAAADVQRAAIEESASLVLAQAGYAPPVLYTAGLAMTMRTQTVDYGANVYAPKAADLPFTTSGVFETAKFRLIQGIASTDLAAGNGGDMVGYLRQAVGTVLRTLRDKASDIVHHREFMTDRGGVIDNPTAMANLVTAQTTASDAETVKVIHSGTSVFTNFYESYLKTIAALPGRWAWRPLRLIWQGDAVSIPGSGGVTSSSNQSRDHTSFAAYTAGNIETYHTVGNSFGIGVIGHIIADLKAYAGGLFGFEFAVRDGTISPSGVISALSATGPIGSVTIAGPNDLAQYFGGGISNRSGVYRGRALLNDTRKISLGSCTLDNATRVVAAPTTAGIQPGDYGGFDADTSPGELSTTLRYLSRVLSVTDGTHFVLDNTPEGDQGAGDANYQGPSTSGAFTVFPATIPSGYKPGPRTFSFAASLGSNLDSRFQVGDTVIQHPSFDTAIVGGQIDLWRKTAQRVLKDLGQAVVNNGRKARAAFYAAGNVGGLGGFASGVELRDVDNGVNMTNFPKIASVRAQGMSIIQRNQAPAIFQSATPTYTPIKGDMFLRADGSLSKNGYLYDGANWHEIATVTVASAASMPVVDSDGWRVWVTEFGYAIEWAVTANRWQYMGLRCIGTAAQRPISSSFVIPIGFKYFATDATVTSQWNGSAWV